MNLSAEIREYIKKNNGFCKVYPAPFAVFLNKDDKTYVEHDISIICDKSKLDDRGCVGAPDWIIEIASPSTKRTDYGVKLFKYRSAGVREYWIVNPLTRTVNVYDLEKEELTDLYSFDDDIQVCIYDDLTINITELLKAIECTLCEHSIVMNKSGLPSMVVLILYQYDIKYVTKCNTKFKKCRKYGTLRVEPDGSRTR